MDIGSKKQLFIDERFIEYQTNITLCMNPPVQHPEPLLVPDKPWEDMGIGAYNTVWREADGRFRMWYDAGMKGGLPQEGARRLAYAESEDGLHWTKPELGLIPFRGSTANNIVAPHNERQSLQGACVFRDERAPEAERYKLWTKFQPTDDEIKAGVMYGLWALHSPDGIHWQVYPNQPNPPDTMCDTQNMFFWDDRLELYVGYTRVRETQINDEAAEATDWKHYRCVGRITSPDFQNWSDLEITFEADETDLGIPVPSRREDPRSIMDFYTSCAMKYYEAQDVYLMFPAAYYHWGENDFPAKMDVQMLTSRDGANWQRAGGRKPFMRLGPDDSSYSAIIFSNPWLIPVGDDLWFYFSGTARHHGGMKDKVAEREASRKSAIFRSTMRKDGFISADAGYSGGELTTPLLQFDGSRLELNCDCGAGGWLKAEILDAEGRPVEGFSYDDADVVLGNSVAKTVTWQGKSDVASLAGKPVRLRFVMRDMKLYAFHFPQ